jgi:fatty-acid desaturase
MKSYLTFSLVLLAWVVGAYELGQTLLNFSTQWGWYVVATFYTLLLNEIFLHQVCSHGNIIIDPKRWTYKILVFLLSVDHANGPVTSFCLLHQNHHRHADQKQDLVNYRTTWYSFAVLAPWIFLMNQPLNIPNKEQYLQEERKKFKSIIDDDWTWFCETYRIPLTLLFWGILFILAPLILFKIIFMGRFLISLFKFAADVFGHMKLPFGYRNFDTPDTTYNHLIFHYLTLCLFTGILHNNHHGLKSFDTCQHRWFEFDLSKFFIRPLKSLLQAR